MPLVPRLFPLLASVSAAALLSACSGGGGGTPSFNDRVLDAAASAARIDAIPNTAFSSMPTTGTADYNGAASVVVELDAGESLGLLGRSQVTADFASSTMTGSLTDFEGGIIPASGGAPAEVEDYAGTLVLSNGTIGVNRPNDFQLEFAGDLTSSDNLVSTSGTMLGDFKGTPIRAITATSDASGLPVPVTFFNGNTAPGGTFVDFWGE